MPGCSPHLSGPAETDTLQALVNWATQNRRFSGAKIPSLLPTPFSYPSQVTLVVKRINTWKLNQPALPARET